MCLLVVTSPARESERFGWRSYVGRAIGRRIRALRVRRTGRVIGGRAMPRERDQAKRRLWWTLFGFMSVYERAFSCVYV